ncbi:M23 family metallopeptidase [Chengkuizengella axinellae]|uniref:Peptidoglycan DD-metalloendopeptidase family protein n=1 Tax=Chengkuizengella axinellae TaxID=3064388 RepID=A0ABT9J4X9_9BACL|nr:peptidoglycan DD-metalloendopeptidase family protein [Chengkuizengella sp. 2205SS18-9]MDP5276686.1 peptidoglycan DD-metalloendopeptidase family protein [Chengkuizengella sp. 2205SS18-9]
MKKNKFTFMFIPNAEQSIRRIRFPPYLMAVIPIVIVLIILIISYWQYNLHQQSSVEINVLSEQIETNKDSFQDSLIEKDQTIEHLQDDILELTSEVDEIKQQIDELRELEKDLLNLAEEGSFSIKDLSIDEIGHLNTGVGGREIPLSEYLETLISESDEYVNGLKNEVNILSSNLEEIKKTMQEKVDLMKVTPSIWPTDTAKVTSWYGIRKDPYTNVDSFHSGIDIDGNYQDPIYATADGTVEEIGFDNQLGIYVLITHTNELKTLYMHLDQTLVQEEESITKGQKIALMGSSGRSTGTHLHYEVLSRGYPVNPSPYLNGEALD